MEKHQIEEIKRKTDLVALAEKAGAILTQRGNEFRGCCPLHQGDNPTAFVIRDGENGQYWQCFTRCQTGDAIAFVMKMYHLDFAGALARLGAMDLPKIAPATKTERAANKPPCDKWQKRAKQLIDRARAVLWSDVGKPARAWLTDRGLQETIQKFDLGLIPQDFFEAPDLWGLDGKKIWLPRGITIPAIQDGLIWAVNIRRPVGEPKYYKLRGSQFALFGQLTSLANAIFTEGEFDAMLLFQEAGDLVDVATAGAARHIPHGRWRDMLLMKRKIIVVVDNDAAGRLSAKKWCEFSQRVEIARPGAGNDLTDFCQLGGNLRAWAMTVLGLDEQQPLPAPIRPDRHRQITLPILDMIDYLTAAGLELTGLNWESAPPVVEWRYKKTGDPTWT